MTPFTERDLALWGLIQRTPHVDENLVKLLKKKGFPFPACIEGAKLGTRFQKCRRFYDTLLQECFEYPEQRCNILKKILHDSGNNTAGELLYSLKRFGDFGGGILDDLQARPQSRSPPPNHQRGKLTHTDSTSTKAFMEMFLVIKNGNSIQLEKMLLTVAQECAEMDENHRKIVHYSQYRERYSRSNFRRNLSIDVEIDREKFRERLGNILLTRRDWMDKTLLHVAANSNCIDCIDIILKFATEARIKSELLDAQDAFGQTALHLAIRRKDLQMTKKMIFEGSNLFIRNQAGQDPLLLLFQRLPAAVGFLLDTSVTISGDIFGDQFYFNIDFSILTADIPIISSTSTRPTTHSFHLKPAAVAPTSASVSAGNPACAKIPMPDEDLCTPTSENNPKLNLTPKSDSIPLLIPFLRKYNRKLNLSHELRILHATIITTLLTFGQSRLLEEDILAHPVTQIFLDLKWSKMKILIFTTYTGLRLTVYSLYMFFMYFIYFILCPLNNKSTYRGKCGPIPLWSIGLLPTLIFIMGFALNALGKAVDIKKLELKKNVKKPRFFHPVTHLFVSLAFLIIALWTSVPPLLLERPLEDYEYSLATLGILMSSGLILQVIGNSNWDWGMNSIYIQVYGRVMQRFISVLATFSPMIVAFTLSFNILYPQVKEFSSFWRSFFRLVIMLQGEFEYEDKIYQSGSGIINSTTGVENPTQSEVQFWSGQILFAILGCVMTLILIDVFLGYTVSDINELKKQAEFVRRCNQVEQMAETEIFNEFGASVVKLLCRLDPAPFMDRFNVISADRRASRRSDVVISYDEISETRLQQFRKILVERT